MGCWGSEIGDELLDEKTENRKRKEMETRMKMRSKL